VRSLEHRGQVTGKPWPQMDFTVTTNETLKAI
jgi:hypothetical protein